jgi:hypothetical protein
VVAFLELREQRWTREWLEAEIGRLADNPRGRLLAVFDVLDDWFHRPDFESCSFIGTLLEFQGNGSPLHLRAAHHLEVIRAIVEDSAEQAGIASPEKVAYQLQILMMGSIVSASRGDLEAARRARELAERLLDGAIAESPELRD